MATSQSYKRILIFGAGAVGGYFGSQLALAGYNTEFIARGARLEAFMQHGLTLEEQATGIRRNIHITARPAPDGLYDLIIISVKSKDTQSAADACQGHLTDNGVILSLQNGVENVPLLEKIFGSDRVLGGVVSSGISVPEPGLIHYMPNPKITIGGTSAASKLHEPALHELFRLSGINCHIAQHIYKAMWQKLLWNVSFNPLSAIMRAKCGDMVSSPHAMHIMKALAAETVAAAAANGVELSDDDIQKTFIIREDRANYKTSALQDVEANKIPETEELLKVILEADKQGKIHAPVSRTINEISAFMYTNRWFHSYPQLAADVIVINGNKVLLIERKYPPYGWAIPGGMAELGETIEHTASRELLEETGIHIPENKLSLLGVYSDPKRDPRAHTTGVVYYAYADQEPIAADDAKNAKYFDFDELPELAFDHAKVLSDLRAHLKR